MIMTQCTAVQSGSQLTPLNQSSIITCFGYYQVRSGQVSSQLSQTTEILFVLFVSSPVLFWFYLWWYLVVVVVGES